jgi:hypothetical protein
MSIRYPGDIDDALSMDDGTQWWLSPDVWLNTAVANTGANVVNLRAHLAPEKTFPTSQAEVEVFVGNPSLVMTATNSVPAGTALVALKDLQASPTRSVQTSVTWNVPQPDPTQPDRPDQPGHRCLIARVYPFGSASQSDFQVVADQHEAQRNICIGVCAESGAVAGGAGEGIAGTAELPMGRGEDDLWTFVVETTALGEKPETVDITATVIDGFDPAENKLLLPLLEEAGFRRLADKPPPTTRLEFITPERVVRAQLPRRWPLLRRWLPIPPLWDLLARLFGPVSGPAAQVKVMLEPGRTARLAVKVDLNATASREAQAIQVEQTGSAGDSQGGITLVFLRAAR